MEGVHPVFQAYVTNSNFQTRLDITVPATYCTNGAAEEAWQSGIAANDCGGPKVGATPRFGARLEP